MFAVLGYATCSYAANVRATNVRAASDATVASQPRSPLLTQSCRHLSRGKSLSMRVAPPAGFEWGEVDRERTRFGFLPSIPLLVRAGKLGALLAALFFAVRFFAPIVARSRLWGLYHAYEAAAIARPLLTKSATSGVAYLLGDSIAQRRSAAGPISRGRLTRATIAGAVSHGPQLHYWTVPAPL